MPDISFFPTLNATLNLISLVFLVRGFIAVKRGDLVAHKWFMTTALCVSALFLTSYLYYHYHAGSVKYEGSGFMRGLYFFILVPHIILAALQVPFIIVAVLAAFRGRIALHVRIVKFLWPVWVYVSITGVLVYLMLYILPHGTAG